LIFFFISVGCDTRFSFSFETGKCVCENRFAENRKQNYKRNRRTLGGPPLIKDLLNWLDGCLHLPDRIQMSCKQALYSIVMSSELSHGAPSEVP
jgi:hypothetical protein